MRRTLVLLAAAAGLAAGAPNANACQPDSYCPPPPPWCGTPLEKVLDCHYPY